MKKYSEIMNESRKTAEIEITWSSKAVVGQIVGNEDPADIADLIKKSLNSFHKTLTDEKGFYMLITTKPETRDIIFRPPLYIGIAYKQPLGLRPGQEAGHEPAYDCIIKNSIGKSLFIKLGIVTNSSLDKATKQLYEDIEKCLICHNQPTCNDMHKSNYNSSRELFINNIGQFMSLNEKSHCAENMKCPEQ
jgi:hypothetical protein